MIQKGTLQFLKNLKKNNNKPWFDAHRELYLAAKEDFSDFVQQVIDGVGHVDSSIAGFKAKDCMFRIYKDIRFSKDKTPYKTHLSASFNKGGKKVHLPGYYFHIAPGGNSFFGAGIWMPEAPHLKKIRQEIDYNFKEFQTLVTEKKFKKLFGELEVESAMIRPPQGYCADNPAIEYLKLRNIFAGCNLSDEELTSSKAVKEAVKSLAALKPLVDFLNKALD